MPSENASDGIRYKVILIMTPQVLTILGSTGSIGESTLDVVSRHPENSAYSRWQGISRSRNWRLNVKRSAPNMPSLPMPNTPPGLKPC